ncbi:acyl-CoA carboxylase subunit epsilon [Streptomyces sp. NBC_01089]|uniref:acyl-CoA carboxylase subunit epsilon n=1 Tax=Streptomyces sp. NBC_01089 TaxID=2903747 RepID=UPI003868B32C|nr:acyl-CoA carboxylase subunit epsilon [Streptomyces sp. NBC_01089]WSU46279.1 acyl-CoA carboxylase subunit epsilon [Streptomyces sp. NBC_01089]
MSSPARTEDVIRVERGEADEEELAALVALLSFLARGEELPKTRPGRPAAHGWRPREEGSYRAPHSWH